MVDVLFQLKQVVVRVEGERAIVLLLKVHIIHGFHFLSFLQVETVSRQVRSIDKQTD
jgi:hypothetical protein